MPVQKYPGLWEFVTGGILLGLTHNIVYSQAAERFNYDGSKKQFRWYVKRARKWMKQKDDKAKISKETSSVNLVNIEEQFLLLLQKCKRIPLIDACKELNCSPQSIKRILSEYRRQGYEISAEDNEVVFHTGTARSKTFSKPLSEREIIFGIASDLHFGSRACQITALNEFCEICRRESVAHIFVPGDICSGFSVYQGQVYDVYAHGAEEQENSTLCNLPEGFKWWMLGGNHDYNFIRSGGGHNPLLYLASRREDINYVGFDQVEIPLLDNVDMILFHPSGGIPYSYSYRLQKTVEQISFDELNKIARQAKEFQTLKFVIAGHLHIQLQAMFGPILGIQAGCFEGQTNYLKRKGLFPTIGGWILKVCLDTSGTIRNFEAKFYIFPEIEDDWKNYSHVFEGSPTIITPIFDG